MRQRRTLAVLLLLLPVLALAHPQDQAAPALALVHCTLHQPRPRLPVARLATGTSSSDMQPPNWLPPRPFVVYVTPAVPVPSDATSSTDKTALALGSFHAKVSRKRVAERTHQPYGINLRAAALYLLHHRWQSVRRRAWPLCSYGTSTSLPRCVGLGLFRQLNCAEASTDSTLTPFLQM